MRTLKALLTIAIFHGVANAAPTPEPFGINLTGHVTEEIELWETSLRPYEPQMILYDIADLPKVGFKIDALHAFATPTSRKLMFLETRTTIDFADCELFKKAFSSYIDELFPKSSQAVLEQGSIGHRPSHLIASSQCFEQRTDAEQKHYKAEFVANFTDSTSYSIYEQEKIAIVTGVKLD